MWPFWAAAIPQLAFVVIDEADRPAWSKVIQRRPAALKDQSEEDLQQNLRDHVRDLCARFPDAYWRAADADRAYPEEFVRVLIEAGYLSALIPEEYGGAGLGVTEASIILEEINRAGGNAGACHAQMYV